MLGEEKDKRNEDFYNLQLTKAIYFPDPLAQFCWPWSSQSSWFVLPSVQCQEIKEENKTIGNSSPRLFKFWLISSTWVLLFIFQNPYFFIYSFIHLLFLFCSESLVLISGRNKLRWDSFILVRNRNQCKSFKISKFCTRKHGNSWVYDLGKWFFKIYFICLFIFGCIGSSLLHAGFL